MYKHELTSEQQGWRSEFSRVLTAEGWDVAAWDQLFYSDTVNVTPEGRAEWSNSQPVVLELAVPEECLYLTFHTESSDPVRLGFSYGEQFKPVLEQLSRAHSLSSTDDYIALAKSLIPDCARVFYQIDENTAVVMSLGD